MSKNIIITGTSKGIGNALALGFLDEFRVFGCARSKSQITHKNYTHFCLDATDEKSVVDMVKSVNREFGEIYALINNVGAASLNHLLTTNLSSVKDILNTNFISTFLFTREVAKAMSRAKNGKIVNFSSIATPLNLQGEAIYAASKSAIENFTKTSAKELANFGINVNAIGIAPTKTDLIKAVPKEKINELINRQAIKKFADFDDIKNAVEFLIDEKSKMITGQIIYLGGVW